MSRLAARRTQRHHPRRAPHQRRQLQGLEEARDRAGPGDAVPTEQRVVGVVVAGHGARVRGRDQRAPLRRAHSQRHQGRALPGGAQRHPAERLAVGHPLELQSDGGDPRVVEQRLHDHRQVDAGLVAGGDHDPDVDAPAGHRQIDADVARLRDDRNAPVHSGEPVDVGPDCGAVERVDVPVRVGPEKRHRAGRRHQLGLQLSVTRLGEARCVHHCASGASPGEIADHAGGGVPGHRDESDVGRAGKLVHRPQAGPAAELIPRRMNGPHRAAETEHVELLHDPGRRLAADDGDRLGPQETVEHVIPRGAATSTGR